jgi:hypothetical protein
MIIMSCFYFYVVTRDLQFILSRLPDDTLYYLGYVRNIVLGNGPTLDGMVYTNGVQPLWTLVLLIPATITTDREILLRIALGVASFFSVCSIYVLWLILRQLVNEYVAVLGLLPYSAYLAIPAATSGMETSISLFIFCGLIYSIIRLKADSRTRDTLFAGALMTLMCLCRIDALIFFPFMVFVVYARSKSLYAPLTFCTLVTNGASCFSHRRAASPKTG